jgi:hypothetical protein
MDINVLVIQAQLAQQIVTYQKLKEYYDKYNADVLARVERQKLEKQRLTEVLDKLKEGVVSLELANKQATKLLPGGIFLKSICLCEKQKNNWDYRK